MRHCSNSAAPGAFFFACEEISVAAPSISLDEFRVRAAHTGMTFTEEDIVLLHKGYVGLLKLMERIPSGCAREAEPAHIFVPLGGSRR
jgi:hypothetical protein